MSVRQFILDDALAETRVEKDDLIAKLREANVLDLSQLACLLQNFVCGWLVGRKSAFNADDHFAIDGAPVCFCNIFQLGIEIVWNVFDGNRRHRFPLGEIILEPL